LKWELEYAEKEFSLQAKIAKGLPLPEWAIIEPVLLPGEEFFLTSFYNLSTCRSYGEVTGPIPWRDIVYYSDRNELEWDVSEAFVYIIREMDAEFLKWKTAKQKALIPKGSNNGKFQR